MFGQRVPHDLNVDKSLVAYIYNQGSNKWTNITHGFPCPTTNGIDKFTCATFKPTQSIVMAVGNCNPILNLTLYPESWAWTSISAPAESGIVFNIGRDQENIIFIGNNGHSNESEVYMVSKNMHCCFLEESLTEPKFKK